MTQTESAPTPGGEQQTQEKGPMHEEMKAINAIMRALDRLPTKEARARTWSYVTSWISEQRAMAPSHLLPAGDGDVG